jgi:hypothetical protein
MLRTSSPSERVGFLDDHARRDLALSPWSSAESYPSDDVEAKTLSRRGRRHGWKRRISKWCGFRPLRRGFHRHPVSLILAIIKYAFILQVVLLVATPIFAPSYTRPPPHYQALAEKCAGPEPASGCANPANEQVFVSVSLYDNSGQLAAGQWGDSLLQLIQIIGEQNVFLSIYENDSGALGAAALETLKAKLRCRYSIVNDRHVPKSDFPTIELPDGSRHLKRLAWLSEMRNRALRPLDTFAPDKGIVKFDKVLFMNDVSFHPIDAAHLLFSTNVGEDGKAHYLAACGLDYMNPLLYYDLYAMRDAEGFSMGLPIYPIFSTSGQAASRAAMLAQADAVPVTSCWGGLVAMDAEYIQNHQESLPDPKFQDIGAHMIDPQHPANVSAPVRFRYEPEIFFDACECCLFHADVRQVAKRQGAEEMGTYVNPYIRVAYDYDTLGWLPWVKRWERLLSIPQSIISPLVSLPTHNPHRTVQEGEVFTEEIWVDQGDGGHWEAVQRTARNGLYCGVREMQTILAGKWAMPCPWNAAFTPANALLRGPYG